MISFIHDSNIKDNSKQQEHPMSTRYRNNSEPKSAAEALFLSLGHEFVNFKPDFPRSKLKHTFVLSQYGSKMFGLVTNRSAVYLGIPEMFYSKFKAAKWHYIARVKGQGGLFLVMQIGEGEAAHQCAIRVFIRSKRINALDEKIKRIRVVPMSGEGISREEDLLRGFDLSLKVITEMPWEDLSKQ